MATMRCHSNYIITSTTIKTVIRNVLVHIWALRMLLSHNFGVKCGLRTRLGFLIFLLVYLDVWVFIDRLNKLGQLAQHNMNLHVLTFKNYGIFEITIPTLFISSSKTYHKLCYKLNFRSLVTNKPCFIHLKKVFISSS